MRFLFFPKAFTRIASAGRVFLVSVAFAIGAPAWGDELFNQFSTVRGQVSHLETPQGRGYLRLDATGKRVLLPAAWRMTNVDQTMDLGSETAVIISYAEPGCDARLALLVVAANRVWGPYGLGQCNEILAYQRSADGDAFVAIRAESADPLAWTYSVRDQGFRGPVQIDLPPSLASLAPARAPSAAVTPVPPPPAVPGTLSQGAVPAPGPAAPSPAAPSPAEPVPTPVPVAPPPSPAPAPAAKPPASGKEPFSRSEAESVADDVRRKARAQRRVFIDLT